MENLKIPENGKKILELRRKRDEQERQEVRKRLEEAVKSAYKRGKVNRDVTQIFSKIWVDKPENLPVSPSDRSWLRDEFEFEIEFIQQEYSLLLRPTEELRRALLEAQKAQDEEILGYDE